MSISLAAFFLVGSGTFSCKNDYRKVRTIFFWTQTQLQLHKNRWLFRLFFTSGNEKSWVFEKSMTSVFHRSDFSVLTKKVWWTEKGQTFEGDINFFLPEWKPVIKRVEFWISLRSSAINILEKWLASAKKIEERKSGFPPISGQDGSLPW